MPKEKKKLEIKLETNKSAKESSAIFHSIMKASVANNPKPELSYKNMKIRLSHLDKQVALFYSHEVPVTLIDNGYEIIGTCKIIRDDKGNHYGTLELDKKISIELYCYYERSFSLSNDPEIFVFSGLNLSENELHNRPTKKLKEIIVL